MTDAEKSLVSAIRADSIVGNGTCSIVDECYEDAELLTELRVANISSPRSAVRYFRELPKLWADREADIRGEIF